ncbi:hypothetical protein BST81_25485 [Leptolyngbya sp. 'hensonii']|uniref:CHAT domain-containing protein n=1 Tax=Leptolyngbya sp. 'hensonii' TaxID=1922337 RepID=UPI000950162A|nr:CHAT domain-containing tetratricopeptide repeat protein [Leptolyngbya sp. 'hensonii']OLP15565.1 hypothetical protein BST81_25485 [Leptolyngbya sp. 'hensonii']
MLSRSIGIAAITLLMLASPAIPPLTELGWLSLVQAQPPTPSLEDQITEGVYLNQQGWDELMRADTKAALATFEKALAIFRKTGARGGEAISLNRIGKVYYYTRQFEQAAQYYQNSLKIWREIGGPDGRSGEWQVLSDTIDLYMEMSRYEEAIQVNLQALAIVRELKDQNSEPFLLDTLARSYFRLGQYAQSLRAYQEAQKIYQASNDVAGEAAALSNMGVIYTNQGEYAQALDAYQKALDLYVTRLTAYQGAKATVLNNMAGVYFSLGQYQKALQLSREAMKILKRLGVVAPKATFGNVTLLYDNLGQFSQPVTFRFQEQASRQNVGDAFGKDDPVSRSQGATLTNIGQILLNANQPDQALQAHQQAFAVYQEAANLSGQAIALSNIGYVYEIEAKHEQALKQYQQALEIYRKLGDRAGEGVALSNIGKSYSNLKRPDQAQSFYQKALVRHREVGDRSNEGTTLRNLGQLLLQNGRYAEASQTLLQAVTVVESLRPGLSDANKVSIFETQSRTYSYLQQVLLAQNKIAAALEISERSRARAFAELLAQRLVETKTSPTIPALSSEQIQNIAQSHQATLVEYALIEEDVPVQGIPEPHAVRLLIWVVQPTGKIAFREVDLQAWKQAQGKNGAFLEDLVKLSRVSVGATGRGFTFNENLEETKNFPTPTTAGSNKQRLKQLYDLLIQPIADLLPPDPNARVVFVPQKSLFLVPFPALLDGSGKYLVETHTPLITPSIQILQLTRQQREQLTGAQAAAIQPEEVLIVGNPTMPTIRFNPTAPAQQLPALPGAEKEARDIATLLKTEALTGNQGSKTTVLTRMVTARIIHLATHGLLDDFKRVGVPGAIALAPSGQDDGLLTTGEILNLKLQANLVVLSACDTGRGRITGDGVIGLSRSLIVAGTPSVIVSLWQVPDIQTGFLMTHFYQNLSRNSDKAQSLRQAMLATLKQYPDPKDWAAFTLIGEAD